MNRTLSGTVIFLSGAAIGAVITWATLKTKYERIAQDEIAAVKDVYYKKRDNLNKNAGIIEKQGYATENPTVSSSVKDEIGKEEIDVPQPYVISPEEFDTMDYEVTSLDYYADGILVDASGEVVQDVEDLVGDALSHFGEYEDDSVFVRDDVLRMDYEILRDSRPYPEEI